MKMKQQSIKKKMPYTRDDYYAQLDKIMGRTRQEIAESNSLLGRIRQVMAKRNPKR